MKRRFVAKPTTLGGRKVWGVYDVDRACWPGIIPGFGRVKQDRPTEQEAEQEAERLARHYSD